VKIPQLAAQLLSSAKETCPEDFDKYSKIAALSSRTVGGRPRMLLGGRWLEWESAEPGKQLGLLTGLEGLTRDGSGAFGSTGSVEAGKAQCGLR
jgi:hypothetical protein